MSTNQLSSLAIRSTVQTFKQGHLIVSRDDDADGFYILLSGHLAVTIEGRLIAELSEGDTFGERGLLEGATHETDVTVASVDAEVLHVSTRSFHDLLRRVPAIGWGIWETVAGRRESGYRPVPAV
jgi:CRP-like cAMP-binding protein